MYILKWLIHILVYFNEALISDGRIATFPVILCVCVFLSDRSWNISETPTKIFLNLWIINKNIFKSLKYQLKYISELFV